MSIGFAGPNNSVDRLHPFGGALHHAPPALDPREKAPNT
jgi:hypothetical protein